MHKAIKVGDREGYLIPWLGEHGTEPYRTKTHARVALRYTEKEERGSKNGKRFHEQIVRKSKIRPDNRGPFRIA